jgi:hypothetical protein
MNAVNNKNGNAYLFVLAAVLFIFMLVTVALTLSATSRRLTTYYPQSTSLYDLAIAGNEQVYFYLSEIMGTIPDDRTPEETMNILSAALAHTCADPHCAIPKYPRHWELTVTIAPQGQSVLTDTFYATTNVFLLSGYFRVETMIRRGPMGPPTTVEADIVLDGFTLRMVHSRRVVI